MGKIRTIKPELFRHEALFEAERETQLPLRVAFAGLFTVADREGRFRWRPRQIKLDVLPYDDLDMCHVLDALATRGFVVPYESGGNRYGYIPTWHKHQFINNRELPSILPAPETDASPTRASRVEDASDTRQKVNQGILGKPQGEVEVEVEEEINLTSKPDNGFDQSVLAEEPQTTDQLLQSVWDYFIATIGKNPKIYTWTGKRKSMGAARLSDLKQRSGSWDKAVGLMKLCIDRLHSSLFHNGKNADGKKYLSWEILFRSTEQMEKWLDDDTWNSAKDQTFEPEERVQ